MNTLNLNKISLRKKPRIKIWLRRGHRVLGFAFFVLVFGSPVFAEKDSEVINPAIAPLPPAIEALLSPGPIGGTSTTMETLSPKSAVDLEHTESRLYNAPVPMVPPSTIKRAGYILPSLESDGMIVANQPKQERFVDGNTVYINLGAGKGVSVGDRFTVSRTEKLIYHPVLKKPLGYLINILGELEVTEVNATDSKAVIRETYQEMMNGDLITARKTQSPSEEKPKSASEKKTINGYIVTARDIFADTVAANMIVYIDQGSEQMVAPGDILEAYETPETKDKEILSSRVTGELLVIDTKNATSTAVVLKSKLELPVGQKIRYKQ